MTRGYKTCFMLNSHEHEISTAHKKTKIPTNKKFLALSLSDVVITMHANNCWHFNIYGHDKFRAQLSWVWKSFITSGPDLTLCRAWSGSKFVLMVFLKEFFEKVSFAEKSEEYKNSPKKYPECKELTITFYSCFLIRCKMFLWSLLTIDLLQNWF